MGNGRVGELYDQMKELVIIFRIRPGERINEGSLAKELNASRTPLREALNRLVAERLVEFRPGKGFFCRELDPQSIFELYEAREVVEVATIDLACRRASDEDIAKLKEDFFVKGMSYVGKTILEVTERDEAFHTSIAGMSGNNELGCLLQNINERIRYIRWIDLSQRVAASRDEHRKIMDAILDRDTDKAQKIMRAHISKRMDQIVSAVKESYSSIYFTGADDLIERRLESVET